MRTDYEKPEIVKKLAHVFTDYMCKHKTVPVFKFTTTFYSNLLTLPKEELDNVFLTSSTKENLTGKVYGVDFVAPYSYEGELTAIAYSDKEAKHLLP
jgi:hypothetical protein